MGTNAAKSSPNNAPINMIALNPKWATIADQRDHRFVIQPNTKPITKGKMTCSGTKYVACTSANKTACHKFPTRSNKNPRKYTSSPKLASNATNSAVSHVKTSTMASACGFLGWYPTYSNANTNAPNPMMDPTATNTPTTVPFGSPFKRNPSASTTPPTPCLFTSTSHVTAATENRTK